MSKIFDVYGKVVSALTEYPETRGDDNLLIVKVDSILNPAVTDMPYGLVMSNRSHFGLPSCESIRRSRQKAQEVKPELRPGKAVCDARADERIQYENFAMVVKV